MQDFYNKILNSEDSEIVRKNCIEKWMIPVAKKMLDLNNNFKCVIVSIARYWNDEASDATHVSYIPSSSLYTSWEDLFDVDKNTIIKMDKYYNEEEYKEYGWHPYGYDKEAMKEITGSEWFSPDNDDIFIQAFWSSCRENCDQEMGVEEAYNPILVVTRKENGYSIRNLEKIWRTWQ